MPMLNAASASQVRSGSAIRAGSLRLEVGQYFAAPIAACLGSNRSRRRLPGGVLGRSASGRAPRFRSSRPDPIAIPGKRPPRAGAIRCRFSPAPRRTSGAIRAAPCGFDPGSMLGVDALDSPDVAEIAIGEPRERAVPSQPREEPVERVAKLGIAGGDRPREFAPRTGGKRDVEIEIDVARDRSRRWTRRRHSAAYRRRPARSARRSTRHRRAASRTCGWARRMAASWKSMPVCAG